MWGGEPGINFVAQRQAPTRFIYQYPLYRRGYESPGKIEEFLRALALSARAILAATVGERQREQGAEQRPKATAGPNHRQMAAYIPEPPTVCAA